MVRLSYREEPLTGRLAWSVHVLTPTRRRREDPGDESEPARIRTRSPTRVEGRPPHRLERLDARIAAEEMEADRQQVPLEALGDLGNGTCGHVVKMRHKERHLIKKRFS